MLAFLVLPIFAQAADPPTLTVYSVSHDTIYPATAADSALATTTVIDIAFSEQVRASIKILSASGAVVRSLYSSPSVTNPTPKTWNGTNADNTPAAVGHYTIFISATSTAADNLTMTDSSKTITVALPSSVTPSTATSSDDSPSMATGVSDAPSSNGGPAEYLPIPILRIVTEGNTTVSSGADVAFTAVVYDGKGNRRDDALIAWSFGDGMKKIGASVFHQYYGSGEYLAIVHAATPGGGDAQSKMIVTVKDARIKISGVTSSGISLTNDDSRTLDLSFWRLSEGGKEFKIPENTQILAGHTVLFPSQVIELPFADSALLLYPSGEVASLYSAASVIQKNQSAQPRPSAVSYKKVSEVEPIPSARTNIQAHDEAVLAPTAATELAAVGAVSSSAPAAARPSGLLHSPWTLGLLGVIAVAGSAFIFL